MSGERSLLEHINSFSEVLVHPVQTANGHFVTPWEAGYSVQYKLEAIGQYEFPTGTFWSGDVGMQIRLGPKL